MWMYSWIIYPDSLCLPPDPTWSGAFLDLDVSCEEDTLSFQIKNIGTQTMLEMSEYIIVEDAVLREMGQTELLEPDSLIDISLEANGSTFSLLVEQVNAAPGLSFPFAIIEGCGEDENGNVSVGFSNQFSLDDYNTYQDIICPIAVNSFDPNDKQATPKGYSASNYILNETPLEYKIRFQNTGTDTAYNVIIRDTLDELLDFTTIQKGV